MTDQATRSAEMPAYDLNRLNDFLNEGQGALEDWIETWIAVHYPKGPVTPALAALSDQIYQVTNTRLATERLYSYKEGRRGFRASMDAVIPLLKFFLLDTSTWE